MFSVYFALFYFLVRSLFMDVYVLYILYHSTLIVQLNGILKRVNSSVLTMHMYLRRQKCKRQHQYTCADTYAHKSLCWIGSWKNPRQITHHMIIFMVNHLYWINAVSYAVKPSMRIIFRPFSSLIFFFLSRMQSYYTYSECIYMC